VGVAPLDAARFEGLTTTREETLLELLPRRPPARYARLELGEFERRLNNLGIFDQVDIRCVRGGLVVRVREKWTLVPEIDFSSGKSWSDTYALLGATEYNIVGTANPLSQIAYREQRGFGVTLGFNEHDYQRHGWSFGSEVSISTAALRFEDGSGWRTTSATLELSLRSPPLLHE
jgi:outer membrane protein assembly factor BamA